MSNEDIVFYPLNGIHIALYSREELAKDATVDAQGNGFKGFTISYNVWSEQEVDDLVASLRNKGVRIVKEPRKAFGADTAAMSPIPMEIFEKSRIIRFSRRISGSVP